MKSLERRELADGSPVSSPFQRANRCPLWFGANRWTLWRSLSGAPDEAAIVGDVQRVLQAWFSGYPWASSPLVGNVHGFARRRTLELPGEWVRAATVEDVIPRPTMLGDSFASVAVEFVYLGTRVDMPWPVLDLRGDWAPADCVWCLAEVGMRS